MEDRQAQRRRRRLKHHLLRSDEPPPTLHRVSTPADIRSRPINTAGNLIIACAVVCALTILFYAGGSWAILLLMLLTEGLVALCWLGAAVGIGAGVLSVARIQFRSLALGVACAAALGLGLISILILILGLVGLITPLTAWTIIGLGILTLIWQTLTSLIQRPGVHVSAWGWLWLLAMPGLGIALVCAFLPPGLLWGHAEPNGYDVISYHFQIPREWFELGRIVPLEHNVFSFFPFNVEMHYLLAMHLRGGPWAGMYLAQLMHVVFVALSVVGVYGVLREIDAPHPTLGAVSAGVPWMILLAPIGYNEGGLLLFGTVAIGLTAISMGSQTPMRMAALAGAMAGFACGAKLTAVPMLLLGVPLAAVVTLGWRRRFVPIVAFVIFGMLSFSPWLVRNSAWTGNPVFPEATGLFGRAHFSEAQVERWRRAHSPREDQRAIPARLGAMARQVLLDWRFGFVLLPLAIVAFALNWRSPTLRYLLAMLILVSIIWLGFTHLQGRFFVLAIPIAACMIGHLREKRATAVAVILIAVSSLVGFVGIDARLRATPQMFSALGLDQLTLLTPLADVTVARDEHLALVGDARAFLYDVPSGRMHYRTVFDVTARPDETVLEAWLRGAPEVPAGKTIVLIDPNELVRFSRTYWGIPPPPIEIARSERVIIQRR